MTKATRPTASWPLSDSPRDASYIAKPFTAAELENPTTAFLRVVLVGPDPFSVLAPVGAAVIRRVPLGTRSDHQALEVLEVPAQSTVMLTSRTPLAGLFYEGRPAVQFSWQFMLAGAPEGGHLQVVLPPRTSKESYFIDGEPVSETIFIKRAEKLKRREGQYSESHKGGDGGQTGWISKDASGRAFKVVHDSFDGWQFHEIYAVSDDRLAPPARP